MRNLKRALSLALASVMLLGMMAVGTSAKGLDDFSDAADIVNKDAVAVTSEIGIFDGYEDDTFRGDEIVTRAQMAVIVVKMLYGADVKIDQFAELSTFTDVPEWAQGWVNLAASLGIIVGDGDGTFRPNDTVTTAEAATMLSKTLGYFKNPSVEFGESWQLAAVAKATQLGLFGDMTLSANAGLTRDNVAEMTFNALTVAVPVQYNELLGVYYNENQGIIYSLEFNYLETLGYKNFDLVYKSDDIAEYGRPATTWGFGSYKTDKTPTASGNKADLTATGGLIPANVRMLSTDEIVTITNTPDYVYTNDTENQDVYKDLGASVAGTDADYDWTWYVNGEEVDGVKPIKNNDDRYIYTDKGAVTEIYIDDYAGIAHGDDYWGSVTVVEINYLLGEVTKVKDDVATVKTLSSEGKILNDKTFATNAFAEDDLVVFTIDYNEDDEEFFIGEMMEPATVTGEVTHVKSDSNTNDDYTDQYGDYVRLDGESTKYYYTNTSTHMVYDVDDATREHPDLSTEYILYMTPAGYVLGFNEAEDVVDKYLYVEDSDEELKDWIAKVVLADATNPKVEVKDEYKVPGDDPVEIAFENSAYTDEKYTNIDRKIWKYTVSDAGVYSLTEIPTDGARAESAYYPEELFEINNGKSYVNEVDSDEDITVDRQTIFVDVENNKAYVGYDEVPNVDNAKLAYVLKKGIAEIVFILDGDIYDKDSTYFMLKKTTRESHEYTVDGEEYWDYTEAYVDGEKTTLTIAYDAADKLGDALEAGVLYKAVKTIDENYITEVEVVGWDGYDVDTVGDDAFKIDSADLNNKERRFDTDDETVFVLVEWLPEDMKDYLNKYEDGIAYDTDDMELAISVGDLGDMDLTEDEVEDHYQVAVTVVEQDEQYAELVYIYKTVDRDPAEEEIGEVIPEIADGVLPEGTELGGGQLPEDLTEEDLVVGGEIEINFPITFSAFSARAITEFVDGNYTVVVKNQYNEQQTCDATYCSENGLTLEYKLTAEDVRTLKEGGNVLLTIVDINTKEEVVLPGEATTPVISSENDAEITIKKGESVTLAVTATKGEEDEQTFAWTVGEAADAVSTTDSYVFEGAEVGEYTITVTVTNTQGESVKTASKSFKVTVEEQTVGEITIKDNKVSANGTISKTGDDITVNMASAPSSENFTLVINAGKTAPTATVKKNSIPTANLSVGAATAVTGQEGVYEMVVTLGSSVKDGDVYDVAVVVDETTVNLKVTVNVTLSSAAELTITEFKADSGAKFNIVPGASMAYDIVTFGDNKGTTATMKVAVSDGAVVNGTSSCACSNTDATCVNSEHKMAVVTEAGAAATDNVNASVSGDTITVTFGGSSNPTAATYTLVVPVLAGDTKTVKLYPITLTVKPSTDKTLKLEAVAPTDSTHTFTGSDLSYVMTLNEAIATQASELKITEIAKGATITNGATSLTVKSEDGAAYTYITAKADKGDDTATKITVTLTSDAEAGKYTIEVPVVAADSKTKETYEVAFELELNNDTSASVKSVTAKTAGDEASVSGATITLTDADGKFTNEVETTVLLTLGAGSTLKAVDTNVYASVAGDGLKVTAPDATGASAGIVLKATQAITDGKLTFTVVALDGSEKTYNYTVKVVAFDGTYTLTPANIEGLGTKLTENGGKYTLTCALLGSDDASSTLKFASTDGVKLVKAERVNDAGVVTISQDGDVITLTGSKAGATTLKLTVEDEAGLQKVDTYTVTVAAAS